MLQLKTSAFINAETLPEQLPKVEEIILCRNGKVHELGGFI